MLRDDILECLQIHGRQTAKEIARHIQKSEKNVMRELTNLRADGYVLCKEMQVLRYLKLRRWAFKSEKTRFYYLPLKDKPADDILRVRWTM